MVNNVYYQLYFALLKSTLPIDVFYQAFERLDQLKLFYGNKAEFLNKLKYRQKL